VAGSCESGNETSSFFIRCDIINCQELLSYMKLVKILIYNLNSASRTVLLLFMCPSTTTINHNGLIGLLYYIKTTCVLLLKGSQATFILRSGSDGT
jgi:hypothetical protein